MPTTINFVSSSPSFSTTSTTSLTDGTLALRYAVVGGVAVFECCGQRPVDGTIYLAPETWRTWLFEGLDLVVEPSAPSPTLLVRLTDAGGRALTTTEGEPTPVSASVQLRTHLLFADSTGMRFKIALDGAGAVVVELSDRGAGLRPPPPQLPPDPPKPN